ncbi:hypothetical protein ACF1BE_03465 [Streptomyces sp. NPDC014991]|uniref:hypothetical protein n=1 Tax=Streptomyces sp. NPDC014991 TaxID=3364935 RepID=UPI00370018C2
MKPLRARRLFAGSAVAVLLAGGAAIGAAGTASAAAPDHVPTNHGCFDRGNGWYDNCDDFGNRGGYGNFFPSGVVGGGGVVVIVLS